ncbi:hypothetical protein MLD38_016731 [Melastoma candidum]|uniref:Uncharacterized protein n=1 Tax=Melastoma candidum TaxID=119954 RepID=A0ACB9QND3_9MYRT|nr:hypothetical protein MLD38_016731 [Melastoma candidum]
MPAQSTMSSHVRFSSCRGVDFEIKPRADPFAVVTSPLPNGQPPLTGSRSWFPWYGEIPTRFTPSVLSLRSTTKGSSHYCDLELDLDVDEDGCDEKEHFFLGPLEEWNYKVEKGTKQHCDPPPILDSPKKNVPRKQDARLSVIMLDQGLFTVYKRLFVVCLMLNITGLVLAASGHFWYARNRAALFSIANILALTLCRSEAILRVVFWLTVKVLGHTWIPLFLKTASTSILQSLGGIHSGCGVSSIAWLVYALVLTLKDRENSSPEIIGVSSTILALLSLSAAAAFPLMRHLHHNVFERIHRFAGWSALALLWAFLCLTMSYDPISKSYHSLALSELSTRQEFWFTTTITVLILLPWLTVRRVPVNITSPSGHASIIKFHGGVKPGILGRISPSPLSEWHAFGIISNGKDEHMMLAGAVGDFTKSLVSNPPSHLWVRQVHFAGLPYLANMYDRVLLVATGSGICVFLSFLLQPCKASVGMLWVAKGIEQNFGKEIKEMMSGHPTQKVIVHDTAVLGRPNVAEMSVDAARRWGAEVVIVTSNPEGSRDVVKACREKGIAAFGPIWDS